MEPAPELASLITRLINGFMAGGSDAIVDALARHPGSLVIGFDEREWWEGFETIAALFRVQMAEVAALEQDFQQEIDAISAWREGSVGWVAVRLKVRGADPSGTTRMTFVLHEDGAFWRIVQWHTSVPVSNEEALGVSMTTSLDDLLISVQGDEIPSSAASDGSVTIVFTDIEGSTALMESLGEARWLELLAWHDGVIRRQTGVFGGSVVKSQGDGYMIAFPAPGMAAACAVAIQRALAGGWSGVPVPVRIGMHCGNATTEGGDFFGRTVVVAARVGTAAAAGEILVSEPVQESLGESFAFEGVRSSALKGLAGHYSLFPLAWR